MIDSGGFDAIQLQYRLFFQHLYDPDAHAGQMLDSEAKGLGIAIMRPFVGGVFPRWLKLFYPGLMEQVDVPQRMGGLLASVLLDP